MEIIRAVILFLKILDILKKEFRVCQSWLQKQQSKVDNFGDQEQDYKESTNDTYQIGKVSLLNRNSREPQPSKES